MFLPGVLFFLSSHILICQTFTEQTGILLTGVSASSVAWGDYDNDGDLDILLTGGPSGPAISKIYRNDGTNTFTEQTAISLTGVKNGSSAWCDFDNDGDLDILLTGEAATGKVSEIYRNNGNNSFTVQSSIILTGVYYSSVDWGDYDNDGNPDILLTGYTGDSERISKIYRNNGDITFTEQITISLPGVYDGSADWGDYDNDGDLDILLIGWTDNDYITKIYRNNSDNTFIEQSDISLQGADAGLAVWGDYDNDSYLDIIMTGNSGEGFITKIYRNNSDNSFSEQTDIILLGMLWSSVAWGDYDNDGNLDILLTGWKDALEYYSIIYRNNGDNSFTEQTSIVLTGVYDGSSVWGDYDNDGDLDILLTGTQASSPNYISKIYSNEGTTFNTAPSAPSNPEAVVNADSVTFTWDMAVDSETPQNVLTYNIYVETMPEGVDVVSPMASTSTGYRRIPARGNAEFNYDGYTIHNLEPGTYYWGVQAIDQAFAGGEWAYGNSFTIPPDPPVTEAASNITQTSFTANWSSSAAATGYLIDVASDQAFTSFVAGCNGYDVGNATSHGISGLTDYTEYFYRIRAYNVEGTSTYSDTMSVVTLHGSDYYVDATDGDNSTGDGTAIKPWKTITYTLDNLTGTGRRTIHVAPGTYDTALGEIFPLLMVDSVSLVGNGSGSSIINADYTNYIITCSGILDPEMRIEGFTITGGTSAGYGGIYISMGSLLRINDNLITDNWAFGNASGGALHIVNSSPRIEYNQITANHGADINQGACIYISGTGSAPVISNNTISENSNDVDVGGGVIGAGTIYVIDASGTVIHNNIITDNNHGYPWEEGGVVYMRNCSPSVKYNLIAGSNGNGICVFYSGSSPSIVNNTISDHAHYGIFLYAGTPDSIVNNIISYNGDYGIYEYSAGYDPEKVWYNLFYQNSAGHYYDEHATTYTAISVLDAEVPECENNIEGDPLYIDRTHGNYHLDNSSPAINAGDPNSPLDPDDSRADIGAYYYTPPPDAPVATAATEITYYSFDANWTMSEGASGYNLDVSTDVDFTTFVTGYNSKPVMNESVFTVTGLDHNIVYYYRVRASNYTGSSGNSNVINVATLQIPAPEAPVELDATNISTTSFSANWDPSDLAAGYYLDVALDDTFTSFVSGFNNHNVENVTTYSVTGLTPNTDYYYRVRAYNDGGVSTYYSNTVSLTTLQILPPNTPAATAATDITQVSFVANWNASATADGYYLDVSSEGQGTFLTFLDGYNALDVGDVTSYTVTGLTHSSQYFYRLRAYNAGGESSNSAVISVITLPEPPPAPVALEASETTYNSFTANWEHAVPNTDGYYIDWTTDNTFTVYDRLQLGYFTSYNLAGLDPNTTYYYRIKAYNNGGIGEASNIITVTTLEIPPPDAPVAVDPPYVGQLDFKAAWYISENATGYFIDVATDNTFTSFVDGYENLDVGDNLNYIIRDLTANTTYYYRVRAYNNKGTSDNSNVIIVTTLLNPPDPPAAPTADPPTNITQTSFTANWSGSDNAVGYELDVATDDLFTNYVAGYEDIGIDNSLSCNVTGLSAGTTYYYRVRAYHLVYTSDNSETITVTTLPDPPEIPVAKDASALTQTSFKANWETSETATGYYLDVASDDSFTTFITGYENLDVSNVLSYSVTGLTLSTTYYYRVRAYNDGGESGNSNYITVTTLLDMPDVPSAPVANNADNITQTGFTASWSSIAEAEGYYLDVAYDNAFSSHVTGYYSLDVGNMTTLNVSGLLAKTDYYYRVSAYNVNGTGEYSNVITVTTLPDPPPPPTGLTGFSCNDLVYLSWNQSTEPDFDHYTIFIGTSADDTPIWDTVEDISDPTYTVSGLTRGETYFFRVKIIITPDVRSDFSSAVSVKVKTGVIPHIKAKWGDVLICYNIGDSLTQFRWYRGSSLITNATKQYYITNKQSGSYYVKTTDNDGCVNSSNIIDIGSKSLTVYPNPVKSNFTLNLCSEAVGETVVSLFKSTGMKALEYRTEKKDPDLICQIDVGNLKDGIYLVEVIVNDEEINYVRLVIIE